MTTNNHTAISTGALANASTFNTPLGALDLAIGNLATLKTKTITSMVAAANDVFDGIRSGAIYEARGGVDWDPVTKILTITAPSYIVHGRVGIYLSFTSTVTINFSAYATGLAYGYVSGVTPGTTQAAYSTANVKTEAFGSLTNSLNNPDVYVLATYEAASNQVKSPFFKFGSPDLGYSVRSGVSYEARSGIFWDRTSKILSIPANSYIVHGHDNAYVSFTSAISIDFSSYTGNTTVFAYVDGITPGTAQPGYSISNIKVEDFLSLTNRLSDPDVYVLATFVTSSQDIRSPFWPGGAPPPADTRPWTNLYPNLTTKLAGFAAKLLRPTADVKIVMWGDSIFARETHTSAGSITPSALPPLLITRNLCWYLWTHLKARKATYKRYDAAGSYFTETGTWASSLTGDNTANAGVDTNWDDEGDRPAYTRISDSTNAAVAWTLGTSDDESGCNLIFRTDTAGDAAATITIAAGNGRFEYWTGAAWAEANGATFSMLEADEGARRGNSTYNKRLKLRKVSPYQNTSLVVSIGKAAADADRLLYWGVELYDNKNSQYIPMLINSARGGHSINQTGNALYDYMDDDVLDHDPDLVIFEIPLINMQLVAAATVTEIVNSVQDAVWGDRGGATNTWNLKTISNDWADFQVLLVIPHHPRGDYASDSTYAEIITNTTSQEVYNAVKSLIVSKGDVAMIDMATAFEREMVAEARYNGAYYTALTATTTTGVSYTTDNTHQNDKGTLVYARHLVPVLDSNVI